MFYRAFFVLAAFLALYFCYGIYNYISLRGALDDVPASYTFPNEQANLTVVEFLDYGCSYCREAHPVIMEAIRRDGRVLYIPRPLAFTSPDAAKKAVHFAYGAAAQGKFEAAHDALMTRYEVLDDAQAQTLAAELGLDTAALAEHEKAAEDQLKENTRVFIGLGGIGTPAFFIGDDLFFMPDGRMPGVEDYLKMFDEARSLQ